MRRDPALDILRQRGHGRLLSAVLNPRYPHALRGIALMIAAVSTFTCLDTTSKYLAQHYPVPAIVWARYVVHMVVMALVLGPRLGAGLLRTTNLRLQLIRGALFVLIGVLGGLGHFLLIRAHDYAPSSVLSPFMYAQLLTALVLGWVVFRQLPDAIAFAGMAAIAASGLLLIFGHRRNSVLSTK